MSLTLIWVQDVYKKYRVHPRNFQIWLAKNEKNSEPPYFYSKVRSEYKAAKGEVFLLYDIP